MIKLSPKTEQIYGEFIKKYESTFFNDLVHIQEDGTFLNKDLCICGLIGLYKQCQNKEMTHDQFDVVADFAEWLEYLFGVCLGRIVNERITKDDK